MGTRIINEAGRLFSIWMMLFMLGIFFLPKLIHVQAGNWFHAYILFPAVTALFLTAVYYLFSLLDDD